MTRATMIVLAVVLACTTGRAAAAATPAPQAPKPQGTSNLYGVFDHSVVRPITRVTDPALGLRVLTHRRREAVNVDAADQVRLPSTWWQPRLGYRPVSVERMLQGPGDATGPAPGPWTVTKAKSQGVSPGFQIEDAKGGKFIITVTKNAIRSGEIVSGVSSRSHRGTGG